MRQIGYRIVEESRSGQWPRLEMIWPDPVEEPVIMTMTQIADSPWPLVKLEERPEWGGWLCARKDVRYWRLTAARIAVGLWLEMVKWRMIKTLQVWRLINRGKNDI